MKYFSQEHKAITATGGVLSARISRGPPPTFDEVFFPDSF